MSNLARLTIALTLVMACVDLAPPPQLQVGDLPLEPVSGGPASGGRTTMAAGGSPASGGSGGNAVDATNAPGDTQAAPDSSPPDADPPSAIDATDLGSSPPPAPLTNGRACSDGSKCASGLCVDGVCCNDKCGGLCQACNVYGAEGTCTPIVEGEDPADECAQDAIATCGRDGTCNGAGQCRKYVPGTECASPGCQGATEAAAGTCDGAGICRAGTTRSCAPNVCKGNSCGSACSSPGDCQAGYFCDGGTCAVKRAAAAACSAAQQCATGFCVDGVCCGSACTETCSACNLAGTDGICTAVPDGLDPRGDCPAQPASSCGRAGACNGARACRLHPATTTCVAASCTGATVTPAAQCDGAGSCVAAAPRSCGGYQCSGTTCGGNCSGDSQCSAGYCCKSGSCQLLKIASLTVYDTANAASWSIQRNFQIGIGGAHPWVDYAPSYISSMDAAANVLLGKEWIKIAAASKLYTGGPQAAITLAAPSDVYIMVDDRWGTTPSFTAGWINTGWNLIVWETSSRSFTFSIFKKTAQTGTVTFPSIGSNTTYDFFTVVD